MMKQIWGLGIKLLIHVQQVFNEIQKKAIFEVKEAI